METSCPALVALLGIPEGDASPRFASGEVTLTVTGQPTTAFPAIRLASDRQCINTLRRVDEWLSRNAIREASSRKDTFNLPAFQAMDATRLSQADRDSLAAYLFDPALVAATTQYRPLLRPLQTSPPVPDATTDTRAFATRRQAREFAVQQGARGYLIRVSDGGSTHDPGTHGSTQFSEWLGDFEPSAGESERIHALTGHHPATVTRCPSPM